MTLALSLWLAATAGHVLLTFRAVGRTRTARGATTDELVWMSVVASVGVLSALLHTLAVTVGISLTAGVAALAAWHVLLAGLTRPSGKTVDQPARFTWPELLAMACVFALMFSWLVFSTASASVDGTDAAHYHVPNAVNLALGGSVFDLPATQHLYPVAGSVIAAWFIVPTGGPLMIDLTMSLALLLVGSSINWLFRLTAGLSGLAWATWLTLALCATPLVRASALVSGDLWFTAGYLALTAALVGPWVRRSWRPADVAAAALALGLLAGSKTSGAPAAALLIGTYAAAEAIRAGYRRQLPERPRHLLLHLGVAAVLAIASGGIWLVRNWIIFGSPLAPGGLSVFGVTVFPGEALQPTTYLSVLGDMQESADYDVGARAARYARLWLGWWFLRALLPGVLLPIDLGMAALRGRWAPLASARLVTLVLTIVPGVILVWLLVGAPWTSLEWTRGFSLRYALPVVVTLALVAFVALFPLSWRWYDDRGAAMFVNLAAVCTTGWLFAVSMMPGGLRYTAVPRIDPPWLMAGAAAAALFLPFAVASARRRVAATLLVLTTTVAVWVPHASDQHQKAQAEAAARVERERAAPDGSVEPHRALYLATIDAEAARGRSCEVRRFFVFSRFDLPLELEGPDFQSIVFYAGRDVSTTGRAGPLGPCDYIVTTNAIQETDRGQALLSVLAAGRPLRQIPTGGSFLLFGR
jgi:hypothetical protein